MTALADVLFVALVCATTGLATGAFTPRAAAPGRQWWPDTDEDEVPPPPKREDD